MYSGGHNAASSSSSQSQNGEQTTAARGLLQDALTSDPEETAWLANELIKDPIGSSLHVPIGIASDCIRLRLSKRDRDRNRDRAESERMREYSRLSSDRLAKANLIRELGLEGAKARMRALRMHNERTRDNNSGSVMYRFGRMIDRLFQYFEVKGMRMEPFQLELMRGVVLGVTEKQFGDTLFKYKHSLLVDLGLAPLGSEAYDYVQPNLSYSYHIEKEYSRYANPYTLCLAPRQCGKSLMMRLLLAAVLLHLDIDVMVQAQNKHMCTTLRLGVESAMDEFQRLPGYTDIERPVEVSGNPENRVYKFDRGYKGSSSAHFLSSSDNVSMSVVSFASQNCHGGESFFFFCASRNRQTVNVFASHLRCIGK